MTAVSAVIPVHNGERYVAQAVASVLGQRGVALECVVVDDGSTDGTAAVLRSFDGAVRVLGVERQGVAAARNAGARAARGEWLAFLDADDVWLPGKTARQLAALAQTGADACVSGYRLVDGSLSGRVDVLPSPLAVRLERALRLEAYGLGMTTLLIRRSVFLGLGGFDEELSTSADIDFLRRLAAQQRVAAVCAALALYRRHSGVRLSGDLDLLQHDLGRILARHDVADVRARGEANLHTYVAARLALRGQLGPAWPHVLRALRVRPGRLVALPTSALARRAARAVWGRWPRHRCDGVHVSQPLGASAGSLRPAP